MKYRQSGELQHQLLGAGGVELDRGFLVGSGAVDGEDDDVKEYRPEGSRYSDRRI